MMLALPKNVQENHVVVHWLGEIPHPVLDVQQDRKAAEPSDDLDEISRRKDEEMGDEEHD